MTLKRSPSERPSANEILQMLLIDEKICNEKPASANKIVR